MDHAEIEQGDVVDRYVLGSLPAVDAARFEEHYVGCQQCLDELELAQRMQDAARNVASEDASRTAAAQGLAVFAWLARRSRFVQLAAMAFLVLLPAAALLRQTGGRFLEESSPVPEVGSPPAFAPQAGTPIIVLRPERGGPQTAAPSLLLELPTEPRWLVFSVELEPPIGTGYRVVLSRDEEEVWRAEELEPDLSGLLNVSFHSSFLEGGDYLLVVDAATADGRSALVGRHAFRVAGADDPAPESSETSDGRPVSSSWLESRAAESSFWGSTMAPHAPRQPRGFPPAV